ncbi:MAG: XTP/dITP diphosphatase [Clostridia bacterium]|nr:XTP/dITP diphosphatase [Clostridia bacterium]
MVIVLASNNKHKIVELESFMKKLVPNVEIKSLKDIGFTDEIVEDGNTFEENSFIKASTIAKLGYIAVADDSGLMVDALNGAPGVYSARYAGEPSNDRNNNEKLLNDIKDVPEEKRTAKFVSVVTCVFPDGKVVSARGECPGRMLFEYRGNGGFGYDPLFYYEPLNKTFAELTPEEKNSISHRARAIAAFSGKFAEEINK